MGENAPKRAEEEVTPLDEGGFGDEELIDISDIDMDAFLSDDSDEDLMDCSTDDDDDVSDDLTRVLPTGQYLLLNEEEGVRAVTVFEDLWNLFEPDETIEGLEDPSSDTSDDDDEAAEALTTSAILIPTFRRADPEEESNVDEISKNPPTAETSEPTPPQAMPLTAQSKSNPDTEIVEFGTNNTSHMGFGNPNYSERNETPAAPSTPTRAFVTPKAIKKSRWRTLIKGLGLLGAGVAALVVPNQISKDSSFTDAAQQASRIQETLEGKMAKYKSDLAKQEESEEVVVVAENRERRRGQSMRFVSVYGQASDALTQSAKSEDTWVSASPSKFKTTTALVTQDLSAQKLGRPLITEGMSSAEILAAEADWINKMGIMKSNQAMVLALQTMARWGCEKGSDSYEVCSSNGLKSGYREVLLHVRPHMTSVSSPLELYKIVKAKYGSEVAGIFITDIGMIKDKRIVNQEAQEIQKDITPEMISTTVAAYVASPRSGSVYEFEDPYQPGDSLFSGFNSLDGYSDAEATLEKAAFGVTQSDTPEVSVFMEFTKEESPREKVETKGLTGFKLGEYNSHFRAERDGPKHNGMIDSRELPTQGWIRERNAPTPVMVEEIPEPETAEVKQAAPKVETAQERIDRMARALAANAARVKKASYEKYGAPEAPKKDLIERGTSWFKKTRVGKWFGRKKK
jgi:hypothetical protein